MCQPNFLPTVRVTFTKYIHYHIEIFQTRSMDISSIHILYVNLRQTLFGSLKSQTPGGCSIIEPKRQNHVRVFELMSKERAGGKGIQRGGPGSQGGQYKGPAPPNVGPFCSSRTLELRGSSLSRRRTARFVYAPSHARLFPRHTPRYAPYYTGGLGRSTQTYSNHVNCLRTTLHPSPQ